MEFDIYTLLVDFMLASIFLFIAKFFREKITFFQSMFVPVSLLAGFLGLAFGQNGFKIIKFSDKFGSYTGLLIIVVFVSIGLRGIKFSKGGLKINTDRIGSYYCFRNIGWAFQYAAPIVFSMLFLKFLVPNLNPAFGLLIPAGFQGGHGTAAALGASLEALGWPDALDLAMTSATIGILTGIFGGIILIKSGTKKHYTKYITDFIELSPDIKVGFVEPSSREPLGMETISPMVIDPLAWHTILIIIPTGVGYLLTNWIQNILQVSIPSFSIGFLVAIIFHFLLKVISAEKYIDTKIISRIGSCCTDFLVFFGVASIKIPIIIKYALPFGLLMVFGIIWVIFHFTILAPRLLKQEWFERGIYVYGYSTGVTAIGIALLRIVDPDNKSCTLDDAAIITPLESIVEIFALATLPIACIQGNWLMAIVPILVYLAILIILPLIFKWWHPHPKGVHQEIQDSI